MRSATAGRLLVLGLPLLAVALLILGPLLLTLAVSVFAKSGFWIRPAFTLDSYRLFFTGVRLEVLERSFRVASGSTVLMLLIAYPIAYLITLRVRPELTRAQAQGGSGAAWAAAACTAAVLAIGCFPGPLLERAGRASQALRATSSQPATARAARVRSSERAATARDVPKR